jgi:hypothetical protein
MQVRVRVKDRNRVKDRAGGRVSDRGRERY